MAETKGVLLAAWRQLLSERFGEAEVASATKGLGQDDRVLLSVSFLPSSWYPFETLHSFRRLTRSLITIGNQDLTEAIGRFMAERACLGVYRVLLASEPHKMLQKLPLVEDLLFKPSRRMEVELKGDSCMVVRYHYDAYGEGVKLYRSICASHVAFVSRMFELAGGKDVKGEHTRCVSKGSDSCEFRYEWRQ
jgi:predicted hydrocarbon binding protein